MAAQFTPRVFFLQVSNESLKSYFESRDELRDFEWGRYALSATDPLHDAWSLLPERSRQETEAEFRAVSELATREGLGEIVAEAQRRGVDLTSELATNVGPVEKAFRVFLRYRRVFDVARQLVRVDHLSSRYWRRRTDVPRVAPDTSRTARTELGRALSAYYRREGRGEFCDVHCYLRGSRHYFVAFPEDVSETLLGYDGGRLSAKCHKGAFEVVYAFDPEAGALDLNAQGDRNQHADLQRIFARTILNTELPPECGRPAPFRIDRLKRRGFPFPTDPADGVRDVRVKALRLRVLGSAKLTFDAGPWRSNIDVYDVMERSLDGQRLPLSNIDVDAVTLQMVFEFDRRKTLTFDMHEDSCNLRDEPEHVVAKRCLRRWEIACA